MHRTLNISIDFPALEVFSSTVNRVIDYLESPARKQKEIDALTDRLAKANAAIKARLLQENPNGS
jgi:hypothetical protein